MISHQQSSYEILWLVAGDRNASALYEVIEYERRNEFHKDQDQISKTEPHGKNAVCFLLANRDTCCCCFPASCNGIATDQTAHEFRQNNLRCNLILSKSCTAKVLHPDHLEVSQ